MVDSLHNKSMAEGTVLSRLIKNNIFYMVDIFYLLFYVLLGCFFSRSFLHFLFRSISSI